MNNSLKNLFFKYQDFPSFLNHSPITSVHDLGSMGETLLFKMLVFMEILILLKFFKKMELKQI